MSDQREELMASMKRFQSERANQIRKEALQMLKAAAANRATSNGKGSQRRPQASSGASRGSRGA